MAAPPPVGGGAVREHTGLLASTTAAVQQFGVEWAFIILHQVDHRGGCGMARAGRIGTQQLDQVVCLLAPHELRLGRPQA